MGPIDARLYLFVALLWILLWGLRRMGGSYASRNAFAPMVFLLTRTPVLLGWAVGIAAMVALLLPGALARGRMSGKDYLVIGAIALVCGLGFAALVVGAIFALLRLAGRAPVFRCEVGETILREVAGVHFLGSEARGGKLIVTTRRLGFRPHRFNVQFDCWSVRLDDLAAFRFEGDRVLSVETARAPAEWLVVPEPRELAAYLESLKARPEAERA